MRIQEKGQAVCGTSLSLWESVIKIAKEKILREETVKKVGEADFDVISTIKSLLYQVLLKGGKTSKKRGV